MPSPRNGAEFRRSLHFTGLTGMAEVSSVLLVMTTVWGQAACTSALRSTWERTAGTP